jgi:hypothetical protein
MWGVSSEGGVCKLHANLTPSPLNAHLGGVAGMCTLPFQHELAGSMPSGIEVAFVRSWPYACV